MNDHKEGSAPKSANTIHLGRLVILSDNAPHLTQIERAVSAQQASLI